MKKYIKQFFFQVTLLSLLFVTTGSQELNLSIWKFDKLIIVLSSINLVLPTITLYSLSMSNFGRYVFNLLLRPNYLLH